MKKLLFVSITLLSFCFTLKSQTPKIEYLAHAAFILESSQGTRIILDPYHSYKQMGFTFPEKIAANLVLITHPHYDHDGSRYFPESVPIYRDAGTYKFDDISFYGISSRHSFADQIAKSGNQNYNIIWVVEMDGVKIAHLGDNGLLTDEEVNLLADVDYIIGHPNDEYYALFKDKVYIPNHYLLPEVTKHTNWMKPVANWLEGKEKVQLLSTNNYILKNKDTFAQILVFQPSPLVKEWSQEYYDALAAIKEGYAIYKDFQNLDESLALMNKAIASAPFVMDGYFSKAQLLSKAQKNDQIVTVLEEAFAKVVDIDWGTEARARAMLARAYLSQNKEYLGYNQYLWLQRNRRIVNKNDLKEALDFITHFQERN